MLFQNALNITTDKHQLAGYKACAARTILRATRPLSLMEDRMILIELHKKMKGSRREQTILRAETLMCYYGPISFASLLYLSGLLPNALKVANRSTFPLSSGKPEKPLIKRKLRPVAPLWMATGKDSAEMMGRPRLIFGCARQPPE